jgi:spermidine/putrescine transport system substrate-binding protein
VAVARRRETAVGEERDRRDATSSKGISRREALLRMGRGSSYLGITYLLAACGIRGAADGPSPTSASPSPLPPKAGVLNVANWPLYIDLEKGKSATLDTFEEQTDIDITYKEDINDNDEFFGTDLRQQLSAGESTGWDVIVMTDWMIAKLIRLGWIQPLHQEVLPNAVGNLDEKFQNDYFDPGRNYSFPWAAGITGIGYNKKLTGRPITSINDLFDPAFKGKVGMFSEMRDTINFALYLDGVVPEQSTIEDVERAVQRLEQQKNDGIVRAYYGNDYTDQLAAGNLALTMAWSGDVNYLKLDTPELEFVVPEEGGNRWSDNMCIPLHAEHPADAHEWIDFVYHTDIATQITEFVWYESPVKGVQELIRDHAKKDPELDPVAESDLVWPAEEVLNNTHGYKNLSEEEEEAWHDLFDPLIQG